MADNINVLYLHHYGVFGGASASLFKALHEAKGRGIRPYFIMPKGGVVNLSKKLGPTISIMGLSQFSNHELGGYRGVRWIILLREIFFIPYSLVAIMRAKNKWGQEINLIHANEISLLFCGIFAKFVFNKPLVIHVRTVQADKTQLRSKLIGELVRRHVDRVVAIDTRVAKSLPSGLPVEIIRNGEEFPSVEALKSVGISEVTTFGIVANFVEYKGVLDFIDAAVLCARNYPEKKLRFHIYGDNYRSQVGMLAKIYRWLGLSRDIKAEIESKIRAESLFDVITLCGFVDEIDYIYSCIDVLCFPSHLNAVGRPVFEAAVFAKPSIVSLREASGADGILDGETGIVVPEKDSSALSKAMLFMADNPDTRMCMGKAARELAESRFNIKDNVLQLIRMYNEVLRGR